LSRDEGGRLAAKWLPDLKAKWLSAGLTPPPVTVYVLIHDPGRALRSPESKIRATHVADQAAAEEERSGLVAVAVSLTDNNRGAEDVTVMQLEWR
jgi:hypothetical protein